MAVVTTFSHKFLEQVVKAEHDLTTVTLKAALMKPAFSFDPDSHGVWASCSASEISAGNGYTAGGAALTSVNVAISASTNQVDITANNVTWTASGGAIAQTGAAVIYNTSHSSSTVVMGIDFGADYSTADGKLFQLNFSSGLAVVDNA